MVVNMAKKIESLESIITKMNSNQFDAHHQIADLHRVQFTPLEAIVKKVDFTAKL